MSRPRTAVSLASLLALGALDLVKGLYFLRHYPQAVPFDAYYNAGLRLMRDLAASRGAGDLMAAARAMKGLAYLAPAGVLYGPWAIWRPGDFQWMRQGLAVLDAVNLVLAGVLVWRWTGSVLAALATAMLWLVFPGYTLNLVRGYPEPFIVFFFLLSLLAFTEAERRQRLALYALSGLFFVYSIFIRVQVMPFFLLVSAALVVSTARWLFAPAHRRRTLAFFAGWLPVLALWAVLRVEVDDPARLESFSFHAFQHVYPHGFWLYLDTDGWMGPYSLRQYPFYLSLAEAARARPALLSSPAQQWIFAAGYVLAHLDESVRTVLVNLYRFLARPTNDYKWDFPIPYAWQVAVQCFVALTGLAGLLRARRPGVPWALLAANVVTLTLLYAVSHVETRYHLPVMAALLLTAGLWCRDAREWIATSAPQVRGLALAVAAAGAGGALWGLSTLVSRTTPALLWHSVAVVLGAAAAAMFFLASGLGAGAGVRRAAAALGGLAAACLLAVGFTDVGWHEGHMELAPGMSVRQRIVLDEDELRALREAEEAYVLVDLARLGRDQRCLTLDVNGTTHSGRELLAGMPRFPLATTAGGRDPAWFAQWWQLPLERFERARLPPTVEVTLGVSAECRGARMSLGLESFLREAGRGYEGVSFGDWRRVSVYRLLYDGEYRLPVHLTRRVRERRSGAVEEGRFHPGTRDLHIALVALRPGGARLEWETAAPSARRETDVAFRAESGRGGEARLRVGGPDGPAIAFPLAAREPFTRESSPLRLAYVPVRLGEDRAEGLYLLTVPAALVRPAEPMRLSVWAPTRLSTDERYFVVRPVPASAEARGAFTAPAAHTVLEGFGRLLDASRNSYPADTGPWELAAVY